MVNNLKGVKRALKGPEVAVAKSSYSLYAVGDGQ